MAYLTSIERLAREEGVKEGIGQGIATGLGQGLEIGGERGIFAGKIQLLEQMLGDQETASDVLLEQDVEALRQRLEMLQKRMAAKNHSL